jgi:hypothetical protein
MEGGRLLAPHPPLTAVRACCLAQIVALPKEVRRLRDATTYPVRYSERLVSLQRSLEAAVEATEVTPARRKARRAARTAVEAKRKAMLQPPRSRKAGVPPQEIISSPRVRRRQKTVHVAIRKGTTLLQTGHGPRVVKGAKTPKVKKR